MLTFIFCIKLQIFRWFECNLFIDFRIESAGSYTNHWIYWIFRNKEISFVGFAGFARIIKLRSYLFRVIFAIAFRWDSQCKIINRVRLTLGMPCKVQMIILSWWLIRAIVIKCSRECCIIRVQQMILTGDDLRVSM